MPGPGEEYELLKTPALDSQRTGSYDTPEPSEAIADLDFTGHIPSFTENFHDNSESL